MIIGVDAGALSIEDERLKVGTYRVTYNLLKNLAEIDKEHTYRLFSFAPINREVMREFGPRMENKVLTSAGWNTFWLPVELKRRPVDIFLGLSQSIPTSTSHNIGFIYDLAFVHNPAAYGRSYLQLKRQTDDLVKRANHIITISHASKKDIIDHYHITEENITVRYPGVDSLFTAKGKAYRGDDPYFIFVGSLNKAKDLPLAIESFALFLEKVNKAYDFFLIGGDYWPDPAINDAIRRHGLEKRVKQLGFIPDKRLPEYYRGAVAFFTTALREGFCLPAAESLACGTPVVSVNRGAIKEVVADAGLIADNVEPENIANLLYEIATDEALRLKIKKRTSQRAKTFSWETFAQCVYATFAHQTL